MKHDEIQISLQDTEWPFSYTDHDRMIVRAIVVDEKGYYYFVRAERDDDFGKATLIETAGGGVEQGEELCTALRRELKEELGVDVEILCKIGVVSDFYNLIHRHNINNYYLCKVKALGERNLTQDEIERFHLSTLRLSYDEAVREYEKCACTKLGRLIANRELPVLQRDRVCGITGISKLRSSATTTTGIIKKYDKLQNERVLQMFAKFEIVNCYLRLHVLS